MKTKKSISEYNLTYYGRNKENRKTQILIRQNRIRDEVNLFKITQGCLVCGYSRSARSLDFHHLVTEDKENNISRMVTQGRALVSIREEMDKCVVLCRNCHGELHEGLINLASLR